jgi:hypothetical protein
MALRYHQIKFANVVLQERRNALGHVHFFPAHMALYRHVTCRVLCLLTDAVHEELSARNISLLFY